MMNDITKPDIDQCTERQFEKWWWSLKNEVCKNCQRDCKQSFKVIVVNCPLFKKII